MNIEDFPQTAAGGWDQQICRALIDELWTLREEMLRSEQSLAVPLSKVSADNRASARNLVHYLALRQQDRRPLQDKLAWLGLSSLGRAESHVLANLDKVMGILHRLTGQTWDERSSDEPIGINSSRKLLERHTAALLGARPSDRAVRIMVTLPSEARLDYGLVHQLVATGMDIARINCAHDEPDAWTSMASHVRRAAKSLGRPVRILMDLGGPKLRTGLVAPGPCVLKLKPTRDPFGQVVDKARIGLRPFGSQLPVSGASVHIGVEPQWLEQLAADDRLDLVDARGARRHLQIVECSSGGALAACDKTIYFVPETRLKRHGRQQAHGPRSTAIADLPRKTGSLWLQRGDTLRLTKRRLCRTHGTRHDRRTPFGRVDRLHAARGLWPGLCRRADMVRRWPHRRRDSGSGSGRPERRDRAYRQRRQPPRR